MKESRCSGGRPRLWCEDCTDVRAASGRGSGGGRGLTSAHGSRRRSGSAADSRTSPGCPRFVPVFICVFWGQAKPYLARVSEISGQLSPCPQDFLRSIRDAWGPYVTTAQKMGTYMGTFSTTSHKTLDQITSAADTASARHSIETGRSARFSFPIHTHSSKNSPVGRAPTRSAVAQRVERVSNCK